MSCHERRLALVVGEETMASLGAPELLIILVIVIVLFGASRLAGVGAALGNSVREFRKSVKDDDDLTNPSSMAAQRRDR